MFPWRGETLQKALSVRPFCVAVIWNAFARIPPSRLAILVKRLFLFQPNFSLFPYVIQGKECHYQTHQSTADAWWLNATPGNGVFLRALYVPKNAYIYVLFRTKTFFCPTNETATHFFKHILLRFFICYRNMFSFLKMFTNAWPFHATVTLIAVFLKFLEFEAIPLPILAIIRVEN